MNYYFYNKRGQEAEILLRFARNYYQQNGFPQAWTSGYPAPKPNRDIARPLLINHSSRRSTEIAGLCSLREQQALLHREALYNPSQRILPASFLGGWFF